MAPAVPAQSVILLFMVVTALASLTVEYVVSTTPQEPNMPPEAEVSECTVGLPVPPPKFEP